MTCDTDADKVEQSSEEIKDAMPLDSPIKRGLFILVMPIVVLLAADALRFLRWLNGVLNRE